MTNGTSCEPCNISLPLYQKEWLDQKKKERPQKPVSKWVQEALDILIKQERTRPRKDIAFVSLFLLIGGTLAVFTFLLIPTLSMMFILFLLVSFISLVAGYVGIYLYYKEKPVQWKS